MFELKKYKKLIYNCVWDNGFKIVHAYAKHYNFGDNALAYGVKNMISKYLTPDARYENIDVHTTIFNKNVISNINKANLFLVGGGGLIDTFTTENKYWLFNLEDKDIHFLKTPLVFYGLGYNNFENVNLNKKTIKNLKNLINKSISFSVRNDGTRDRLLKEGLDLKEIPDPGFFCNGNHPKPEIDGKYMMIQLAFDSLKQRKIDKSILLDNIVKTCSELLKKNYSIVLAPHCYPDISISKEIVDLLNNPKVIMWNWYEIIKEENVSLGLGYYKYASFVIGMRGHSQICPIGMGTPVISLINHPKHLGLLKKINQTDFVVNITNETFDKTLIEFVNIIEDKHDEIVKNNKLLTQQLEHQTQLHIEEIKEKLNI